MAFQDSLATNKSEHPRLWAVTSPVWGFDNPHTWLPPNSLRLELLRFVVFGMCLHRHCGDCQPTVAGRIFGSGSRYIPKSIGHVSIIFPSQGANFGGMTDPKAGSRVYFVRSTGWFRHVQRYFRYWNEPSKNYAANKKASNLLVNPGFLVQNAILDAWSLQTGAVCWF